LIYRNNGRFEFSLSSSIENVDSAKCIIAGNIDGDSDIDLVLSNGTVLLNSGQGKFIHGTPFNFNGEKIELGDIDGDGDLDLVGITEDSLIAFKIIAKDFFQGFLESPLKIIPTPWSWVIGTTMAIWTQQLLMMNLISLRSLK